MIIQDKIQPRNVHEKVLDAAIIMNVPTKNHTHFDLL